MKKTLLTGSITAIVVMLMLATIVKACEYQNPECKEDCEITPTQISETPTLEISITPTITQEVTPTVEPTTPPSNQSDGKSDGRSDGRSDGGRSSDFDKTSHFDNQPVGWK